MALPVATPKPGDSNATRATQAAQNSTTNPQSFPQVNPRTQLQPMPANALAIQPGAYPLWFAWDRPSAWIVRINGWQLSKCVVELSDGKRGNRYDKIAVPALHFEKLNYLGFSLMTFSIHVEAYDQAALDELQSVVSSVMPAVSDTGLRRYAPTLSKIESCGINALGVDTFLPTDESPPIWMDNNRQCHVWDCSFIQWSKYMGPQVTPIATRVADGNPAFEEPPSNKGGSEPAENHITGKL